MFLRSYPNGRSQRRTTRDNAGCKDNARPPMNSLARCLRNAWLALWRRPTHAIAGIALLAASSSSLLAMLVVLDAMVVRPPTARAPEELLFVARTQEGGRYSRPDYLDLRDRNRSFSALFAYDSAERVQLGSATLDSSALCQAISPNFFTGLGVDLAQGRDFSEADERDGAEPVALLTEELSRRLRLDVGASLKINAQRFRIIGIVPPGYRGLARTSQPELFIPLFQAPIYREEWAPWNRDWTWLRLGGRLLPGVSPALAHADLERISRALALEHPDINLDARFELLSLLPLRVVTDARARTLLLLGFAVALLFVLAFTNFLTLSLLRLFSQRREIALRMALGATDGNITRSLLLELISLLVLGLGFGRALTAVVLALLRSDPATARLFEASGVHVDARSLWIVLGCSSFAALLVWLFVARQARVQELLSAIKDASSAPGRRRGFVPLLAAQLAIALCLVTLSVAFIDTSRDIVGRPLPFRTDHVFALRADVRKLGAFADRARSNSIYSAALASLRRLPGVLEAGASGELPVQPNNSTGAVLVAGLDPKRDAPQLRAWYTFIDGGFFATFGIELLAGRGFSEAEVGRADPGVVVVNGSMARRFWHNEEAAIGQIFRPWDGGPEVRVIGVVADVPSAWDDDVPLHYYLPFTTTSNPTLMLSVHVESETPEQLAALEGALAPLWPSPADRRWLPLQTYIGSSRHDLVSAARIASWLALLGVLVVASGLYFSSAFAAAQTLRESALRMALGASPSQIVREHFFRYRWGLLGGLLAGIALALSSQRILSWLQVPLLSPAPGYVALATLILALTAVAGLCAPLWRLRRLDVVRTLQPD
jgi:predicted permease